MDMERNKKGPLVTVIAMCYNHSRFLEETLDSIKNQTHENIELIITDDGSTDNSVACIENWVEKHNNRGNIKFIFNINNKGVCHTANLAMLEAGGEYVQFVSCDDILEINKIQKQVIKLEELNCESIKFSFCYGDVEIIDKKSNVIAKSFYDFHKIDHRQFDYADILMKNTIPWVSILFNRHAMKEIGTFDENLYFEDFDYILRALFNFEAFFFKDYKSAKYRILDVSLSNSPNYRYYETIIYVLLKSYTKKDNNSKTNVIIKYKLIKNYNNLIEMPFYLKIKLGLYIWRVTGLRHHFIKLV